MSSFRARHISTPKIAPYERKFHSCGLIWQIIRCHRDREPQTDRHSCAFTNDVSVALIWNYCDTIVKNKKINGYLGIFY